MGRRGERREGETEREKGKKSGKEKGGEAEGDGKIQEQGWREISRLTCHAGPVVHLSWSPARPVARAFCTPRAITLATAALRRPCGRAGRRSACARVVFLACELCCNFPVSGDAADTGLPVSLFHFLFISVSICLVSASTFALIFR